MAVVVGDVSRKWYADQCGTQEVWQWRRVSRAVIMGSAFEYSNPVHQDKSGRSSKGVGFAIRP